MIDSLVLINIDWYLYSHRYEVLEVLQKKYQVKIATLITEDERLNNMVSFDFRRESKSPLTELGVLFRLRKLIKESNPKILHLVSIKPLIYGNMLARLMNITTVSAVSGMGSVLASNNNSFSLTSILLKWGVSGNNRKIFIFQNPQDQDDFINKFCPENYSLAQTRGSGINLSHWAYQQPVVNKSLINITLSSRIIREKGIFEFHEAAKLLQNKWCGKAVFHIFGRLDEVNPNSISRTEIEDLKIPGFFEWFGYCENVMKVLGESDIVVLPSYYREGIPKSLIEACAIGRPIVTTEATGCRECVDDGINGFRVPIKDAVALSEAMEKLLLNEALRISMGKNSRLKAEREFDVNGVIEKHLEIYELLLN